ncbi:MAG TPA: Gfo/Idh/MocA family oxidoreductase [Streptosporangiaceae bacterium]|jgi:myo-inositol 2-dehydrogenase/D-chiro-inositol 1-dehydrogenase
MRIGLIGAGRIGAVHADTLARLEAVSSLVITDADTERAAALARRVGARTAPDTAALFAGPGRVDGVVIATGTAAHAELVAAAADAGLPVFCEKPIAADVTGTRTVLERVARAGVQLHVGFQRRFDAGYRRLRQAVRGGELGRLHTLRGCTSDPAPPPAGYIATSGGLFRDCSVHDFDAIRWITGRPVVGVYATGTDAGEPFFAEAGDVDTAAAVLTLEDGVLATVTATRYNGAGYDVRLEACGSKTTLVAGLDRHTPLASADDLAAGPAGPPYDGFIARFHDAYVAELEAFTEVVAGRRASPCTGEEALDALLVAEAAERSRLLGRPVTLAEVA